MNIIQKIQDEKIADNPFQAAHIANGLKLAELKSDEERMARVFLYRKWRNAGEPSKVAYQKAIDGEQVTGLFEKAVCETCDGSTVVLGGYEGDPVDCPDCTKASNE